MSIFSGSTPTHPAANLADAHRYSDPVAPCALTKLFVQVVHTLNERFPLAGATVDIAGKGPVTTNAEGWGAYDPITPGTYDITARHDAWEPDPATENAVTINATERRVVKMRLRPPEIRLHVDADRDGAVDDDWSDAEPWAPGDGTVDHRGAVVLCNSDRDDAARANGQDHDNGDIDTAVDLSDVAPLDLRKTVAGHAVPAGFTVRLHVSDPAKLRVFDTRVVGGTEIIGPNTGNDHTWTDADLGADRQELGMEAIAYPSDASGKDLVELTLTAQMNGVDVYEHKVSVRIAPWIAYNHRHLTTRVHVFDVTDNATFCAALNAAVIAGGAVLQQHAPAHGDRWMQDIMEPGFSSMPRTGAPGPGWHMPAVLRARSGRDAEHYPRDHMLGQNHGFLAPGALLGGRPTMDSFGNLECSPSFTHADTGRDYKFGRIIHGGIPAGWLIGAARQMSAPARQFLTRQMVQEPLEIDTSWLNVGHVDEIVSFLPVAGGSHNFRVVMASPQRAMTLLNNLRAGGGDARVMLDGYLASDGAPPTELPDLQARYSHRTVGDFLDDAAMVRIQTEAQAKIDHVRTQLTAGLNLAPADFIEFPVLFEKSDPRISQYIAYTAGSVNMLVITGGGAPHLVVPKPFGPTVGGVCDFETDISAVLLAAGVPNANVHYVDDFATYHALAGEIHCGTNSERTPPNGEWWWEMDWV